MHIFTQLRCLSLVTVMYQYKSQYLGVMQGRACDLVTGEERQVVSPDGEPASHVACTVEMSSVKTQCKYIQRVHKPRCGILCRG